MSGVGRAILLACTACSLFFPADRAQASASRHVSFQGESLWHDLATVKIRGVLSKPEGPGPFPAVVLLPNCGGPKETEFARFWPRYLNAIGYVTLNVDDFTPRGAAHCTRKVTIGARDMAQDAYGALDYVARLNFVDADRVAVLGSSIGAVAINGFAGRNRKTSRNLRFMAAIALYPSNCRTLSPGPRMIPTAIILGDREAGVESCRKLANAPLVNVTILQNAHHGFDQPSATPLANGRLRTDLAGNRRLYSKVATERAQALVKSFLASRLARKEGDDAARPAGPENLPAIAGRNPYAAVKKRDADGDGKVSRSEWDKSAKAFSRIDADRDGFLTPQEFFHAWQSRD